KSEQSAATFLGFAGYKKRRFVPRTKTCINRPRVWVPLATEIHSKPVITPGQKENDVGRMLGPTPMRVWQRVAALELGKGTCGILGGDSCMGNNEQYDECGCPPGRNECTRHQEDS